MRRSSTSTRSVSTRPANKPSFVAAFSQRLAFAALAALGLSSARAGDLYWDPGTDGDSIIGGAGAWNTSSTFWDLLGTDLAVDNVAWVPTETAVFGGTGGNVALSTGISADGLRFDTNGYSLTGNSLTLTGSATINTATAGTTTISSTILGSAGLVKTGVGTLTLGPTNTYTGGTTISAGTLSLAYTNGQTPVGSGVIQLDGGTLSLTPSANTGTAGLSGRQFASTISDTARIDFTQTAASVRTDATINTTAVASGQAVQWVGKINIIDGSAPYTFRINSDDGSRLYIDGVLVVQNDGAKGPANGDSGLITLSPGLHDVRIDYVNSGSGGAAVFSYSGPDQASMAVVPSTRLFTAESNSTAASSNAVILGAGIGNAVNVTSSSTIALKGGNFTQTQLGQVTFSPAVGLTLTSDAGQIGKSLRFAGPAGFSGDTTLNLAGDGTLGANLYFDGALTAAGSATISKSGSGRLYFGQTAVANSLNSTNTIDVQAGTMVLTGSSAAGSFNPIGSAVIKLSGGSVVLDSKVGSTTAATAFNNNITVTENATIQDIASGGSLVTLGSAGGTLSVAAGKTLTLDAIAGGNPVASLGANMNVLSNLTGSGTINIASTRVGTLTITPVNGVITLSGNNSGFTGTFSVPTGLALTFNSTNVATAASVNLGGAVSLLNDGNGTGQPQTIVMGDDYSLTAPGTITVNRLGTSQAPLFTTALNKTIQIDGLTTNGFGLTVNNNNAYSLRVNGTTTLSGTESFSVATANNTGPGLPQGLVLGGKVTGTATSITKAGAGTMVLEDASNDFTGNLTVTGGVLGAASDAALGNAANTITLNGATAAFEAFGTFSTNRTFTFSNATTLNNQILVTRGNTLTLNSQLTGANGFQKGDPGTLVLTNNTSSITGAITASGGILRITQSGALGSTTGLTVSGNEGTAFQLDGSGGALNFGRPISLGATSGIQNNGALENFAGSNAVSGAITLTGAATIGNSAAGTTLSLTGGVTGAFGLTFNGVGDTEITTTALGAVTGLTRNGTGTTTLRVASPSFVSAIAVNNGSLVFAGSGSVGAAAVASTVSAGGQLWLDNSATNLTNRFGGPTTPRTMNLVNGTFRYTANGGAVSTESLGTLSSSWGGNTIRIDTGSDSTVTFGSLASNVVSGGSTLLFQTNADGTGATFGSATNKVVFTTAPTLTGGIIRRAIVFDSTGGTPTYNLATGAAATSISAYTAYNNTGNVAAAAATDNMRFTSNASIGLSRTLNTLTSNGTVQLASAGGNQTLTLTAGDILVQGGAFTIGSGVQIAGAGNEIGLNVAPGAALNVNAPISNANNLTIGLGGTVNFNNRQFFNTATTNFFTINGGTVNLNGGDNTLFQGQGTGAGQGLAIGTGATLDLKGTAQVAGDLRSVNNTALFSSGGTLTSSTGAATFFSRQANSNWGGVISGNVTFAQGNTTFANVERFYNDNTYTGRTGIMGGTLELTDLGRLSATSGIDINYGQLTLANGSGNNGRMNLTDRVSDAANITMRGGFITFAGRAQSLSTETLGSVTLAAGLSDIQVTNPGTGVNSATLTLTDLARSSEDATLNTRGAGGQLGSASRIIITSRETTPGLTNNIVGGWAVFSGTDFLSYVPGLGAAAVNAAGFAGYDGTTITAGTTGTQNIKLAAAANVLAGGLNVNSLIMNGNITFANTADTVNITSGGLLKSAGAAQTFGAASDDGRLTAGGAGASGTQYLYLHHNAAAANTMTINSRVVDNGSAPVRLVASVYNGGNIILNSPNNSYTGGTVVNGWASSVGTLTIGAAGSLPAGGLTISNATVAQVAGGTIAASNDVTLNGGGILTLVGNNTLDDITFNNNGAAATPAVNTGGVLTLTGTIAASSSNPTTQAALNGTVDFGGTARTLTINPVAYNGATLTKLQPTLNIAGIIQNAGTLTVNGGGLLQLGGQSTFSGGINLTAGSGIALNGNSTANAAGNAVASGPLGTGTLTTSTGTYLTGTVASTVLNNLTILGNLNFDGLNNLTFNGTTTLPGGSVTIDVAAPQMTVGLLGSLVNPTTNITKTGYGTLNLNGGYAGTLTMPGGAVSLLADGNGNSAPELIGGGANIDSAGATTITVGRSGVDNLPYFTLAANKTIQVGTVTTAGAPLTVANNNGYGLNITGAHTLVADQTYNVSTASGSTAVQGLTLSGPVTGAFGIIKQGAGTLALTNSGNAFGGAGKLIDIQGGVVSVSNDGALGNASNGVRLNVAGTTGVGFRATGTFGTSRTITLNQTTNAIEVAGGSTLTVNAPFANLSATSQLVKNDAGILELNAANSNAWNASITAPGTNQTLTGGVLVNQGIVRLSHSAALGTTATNIIAVNSLTGAAVQIAGGVTIPNTIWLNTISTAAYFNGVNWSGALQSIGNGVTNTWSGPVVENQDAAITADAGNTLILSGGINQNAHILILGGAGNINVTTNGITLNHTLDKVGSGTANIQVPTAGPTGNGIRIYAGNLVFSGAGVVSGGGTAATIIQPGGTLTLDNTTNVASRLGARAITLNGGNLNLIGGTSAVTEITGAPSFNRGQTVFTITDGGFGTNLQFSAASNNVNPAQSTGGTGATALFRGNNLGSAAGVGNASMSWTAGGLLFNGQTGATGTTNKSIAPFALIDSSVSGFGTSFVTADTAAGGANSGTAILRALQASEYSAATTLAANANMLITTGLTAQPTTAVNSLTFDTGGSLALGSTGGVGNTLTLSSGGVLVRNGVNASISGGIWSIPAANSAAIVHTPGTAALTVSSLMTGGNGTGTMGLIKGDGGTLTLSTPTSSFGSLNGLSLNTLSMQTVVNQGTLVLSGGANTLGTNNFLHVSPGGTLDLNGGSQYVQGLFTDGTYNGIDGVTTAGGTVTSSAAATLVTNSDGRSWAGTITGNVFYNRTGTASTTTLYTPQTYTGGTLINGGAVLLRDYARLANTSAIDVNYASLTLDNAAGAASISGRLGTAPITLRGGTFLYAGRAGVASTESIGSVSIAEGMNAINVLNGGTNVNSADLTIASLSRPVGSAGVVLLGEPGGTVRQNGQLGSASRLLITSEPTLSNNIIGPWAIVSRDWASYVSGMGTGQLNATGFAGYAPSNPSNGSATDNVRITGNTTLTVDNTINTLNFSYATTSSTLDLGAKTLTLAGGGLMMTSTGTTVGTISNGSLTSGYANGTGTNDLYLYHLPYAGTGRVATISANVVDKGATPVRLIVSSSELSGTAQAVTLNNANTNTGGLVANLGTVVVGAAGNIPAGGIALNSATLSQAIAGQNTPGIINSANVVTLNGPSTLNLSGVNTLAGLIINNTGATSNGAGTSVNAGPTVNTFVAGAGSNGTGTLTIGASGIVVNSSNVATTASIQGRLNTGTGLNMTVNPIMVNGDSVAPFQGTLSLQGLEGSGNITKAGNGVLLLNNRAVNTGVVNVTGGGIAIGTSAANGANFSGQSGFLYAEVNLGANTFFNLNNTDGYVGSLSGSGNVYNVATSGIATGRTLGVGINNASTTFSGSFARWSDALPATYQVIKVGSGTLTLTGTHTTTSNLQVSGGGITYSGASTGVFGTTIVLPSATLTLDNAGTNVNHRLTGGAGTGGTLNVQGGNFRIVGNSSAATSETIGTLNLSPGSNAYGRSIITLEADPNQSLTFTAGALTGQALGSTSLIRGLSSTAGNGQANLVLTGGLGGSGGTGANGTTTMSIRPDIIGDASISGTGTAFVTKDSVTGFLRPLTAAEMVSTIPNAAATGTVNYGISTNQELISSSNIGSLTLNNAGVGLHSALTNNAAGALPIATQVNTGGILAVSGNSTISTPRLEVVTGTTVFNLHTVGNLNIDSVIAVGTGGLNKSGDGTLTLSKRSVYSGQTTLNAGTTVLSGGENTLPVFITAGAPGTTSITLNGPTATLDLNGNSQIAGTLGNNASARYAGGGGTITNTSGTLANFYTLSGSAQNFSGTIAGNLSFNKAGNNALTFSNAHTYTGSTNIRTSTLTLVDSGALTNTSAVNLYYSTLALDQSGINPVGSPNLARLAPATPVNLRQSTLSLVGGGSIDATATFNTVNLTGGHSTVSVGQVNTGGVTQVSIGNLARTDADATVNFTGGSGGFFSNNPGLNQSNLFIGSIDGVAIPATIPGKILGGWALVSSGEFATYISPTTTGANGQNFGIVTMNGTTGPLGTITQDRYESDAATFPASNAASNVRLNTAGTVTLPASGANYNALAVRAAGITVAFAAPGDVLNITSGGLALTNGTAVVGAVGSGTLTAGGASTGLNRLYVHSSGATINSVIANNPGGTVRLVANTFGGTLTLAGANTYTGGTVINGGSTLALTGAGTIPAGGLTINGSTVTTNALNQIASANSVTLNGSSTLTLGNFANTLDSLTFNNTGGATTPTVATGTTSLTLSATNAITSVNDNLATVPLISGTSLVLPSNASINTSSTVGVPVGLAISAPISSGGVINKDGTGGLAITVANTFAGGVNLNAGTLIVGNNTALGTGTLTVASGALVSDTAIRTLSNAVVLNGNLTLGTLNGTGGSAIATNGVILNGTMDLGASQSRAINVNSHLNVSTIGGIISGVTSSLTKTGPGTLVLSGANTYDGGTNINEGTLRTNATGLGTAGTITFGGGILSFSAAADYSARFSTANNQPFYFDTNSQNVTLASSFSSATGGSLAKFGAGNLIITNGVSYTGSTVVSAGTLQFGSGNTSLGTLALTSTSLINSGTFYMNRLSADTATFGTGTGTGNTVIDQGTLSFTGAANFGGTLIFGNQAVPTTTTTIGNLDLAGGGSFAGLASVRTNNASPVLVSVGSGQALTLAAGLAMGVDVAAATGATQTKMTVSGGGSLAITGGNVQIGVSQTNVNAANSSLATLDLSGLTGPAGFAATVTNFNVGQGNDVGGTLTLTNTNNAITATTLNVGNSNGNNQGGNSLLTFGTGTNTIKADTINIAISKATASVQFASQTAGSPGTVTINNTAGTGPANITIGSNGGTSTGAVMTGTLDLRGHNSTVAANTLSLGLGNNTGTGSTTGTLSFDTGTFTATTVNLGAKAGTAGSGTATGTINLSGGSFTINSGGSFTMASNAAATGSGVGNLNITGGVFTSNVDILKGSGANTTANITLNGGTLDMTGKNIGSASQLISNVSLEAGTLSNVGQFNNGAVLTKTTGGTLIIDGTNTYSGGTSVSAGTLLVNGSITGSVTTVTGTTLGGSGTIGGAVTIADGATLAPGNSPGTLNTGDLTMNGGTFAIEIGSAFAFDSVNVTGTVNLTAPIALTLDFSGYDPVDLVDSFTLIANNLSENISGIGAFTFGGTPIVENQDFFVTSGGFSQTFQLSYHGGDGNDVVLSAVPEPASAVTILLGTGMLLGMGRSRRRSRE